MSDSESGDTKAFLGEQMSSGKKRSRVADPDDEDDLGVNGTKTNPIAKRNYREDEDDDTEEEGGGGGEDDGEEDDDEAEEDEDDEDEEEENGNRRTKRRRKSKKERGNRFLDVEAVVDDEEDEDDEGDDYADVAGFIDEANEAAAAESDYVHRRVDRTRGMQEEESAEEIARRLDERHIRHRVATRYNADSDQIPQRLLMPGVNDPSLWCVRCKPGRESFICASIFQRVVKSRNLGDPIDVISVFYRDSLGGRLYLEARQSASVNQATIGIVGVFASRGIELVPIEEMAPLLKIKKHDVLPTPGMWIRLRRGKHAGDLGQVIDVDQVTNDIVGVKFIPRIDLTPRERRREQRAANGKAGSGTRPPARLFNPDDVRKIYGKSSVRISGRSCWFENEEYIDGFCVKDFKRNMMETENIKPTLEEVSRFSGDDAATASMDLSSIAEANKHVTASILVPGDKVEVFDGEQSGLFGTVETVATDVISIRADGGEIHGQIIEVPTASVRKRFDVGEHVKVLSGKYANVSGMVVAVAGEKITLTSDQGEQEVRIFVLSRRRRAEAEKIQVFTKDIREAGDVAGMTAQASLYEQHDMVMLDGSTAAVITKVDGALLRVIDQNGGVRQVSPQQISLRRENKDFAVATDSQGNDMKVGDAMREIDGEQRRGEVINIFRSLFVFLYNRDLLENNGVFVARASSLAFVTPKTATADLGRLNPVLQAQLPFGGASLMAPPTSVIPRGRLINTLVVVVRGTNKGLMGIIKDILGDNARVELATNNKTVTVPLGFLKRKECIFYVPTFGTKFTKHSPKTGTTYTLDITQGGTTESFGARPAGGYDVNPYSGYSQGGQTPGLIGGRTPAARFGQTPNPYAGGKTPNPYAAGAGAGGRTPAPMYGAGGRTPAPGYGDGGKTPAYGMNGGGKTPNPYQVGGGKTPNPYAAGGRTPAPGGAQSGPYAASTPYGSAPTPIQPANQYATPFSGATPHQAPTPAASTPYAPFVTPLPASTGLAPGNLAEDWTLDFRGLLVTIGPLSNGKAFKNDQYAGEIFGYSDITGSNVVCQLLKDQSVVEEVPAEYLRPVRPDAPGQIVIAVAGPDDIKGLQRTTQYLDQGQWLMAADPQDVGAPMIVDERNLCRLWQ